ncbi:MAG: glycosyltransferase [Patescibacteria group bacterium]
MKNFCVYTDSALGQISKKYMTICYFGIYDPEYSRNKILIQGLRNNGVKVIECNSRLIGLQKYFDLIKKHWKLRKEYDVIIVGFPGYQATILVKFLTGKPVIFDAFMSVYDSMVWDRKLVKLKSLKSWYFWFLDWFACKLADQILLDTNEHIQYFVETFKIPQSKFIQLFVGSDNTIIYPKKIHKKNNNFLVHFHGRCIPLQGIEYIIGAAKILKRHNIKFNIIGNSQAYQEIINLIKKLNLKNISLIDTVLYKELANYINCANISLGIFGDTNKAQRVIPNKVFEGIACAKPVITADTPAIRELFQNRENILLCKTANSQDLADKILELKNNSDLLEKIAKNGYILFKEKLTPKILGKELFKKIKKI